MASFEHLLTTNHAPTEEESIELKKYVAGCDDKLDVITQKISALEEQLRSLHKEKTVLIEISEPYRRALSPFRQLPEDVVRAIFVACLETRWNPSMANTQAPVLLTHISRATRMIALSTPELWAAIHIPIIKSVRADVNQIAQSQAIMTARARGVEEWLLRRSGDVPLRISVYEIREYSGNIDIHELSSDIIIDILVSCCSRWKDVHFSCRPTTLSRVASLTRFDVPLLQSFSISSFSYSFSLDETHIWRQSDVLKSPMLKKLRLLGDIPPPIYPVNWSNLTHLYCDHATSDIIGALMDVLRQAVRLIGLDLHLVATNPNAPFSGTIISLPCLTTLVILETHAPNFEAVAILELINAPLLQAMSYNAKQDCPPRSTAFISCLRRSPNI